MADIKVIAQDICDAGARALHRYVEISGEYPDTMPEYFLSSQVFNEIGSKVTCTLETNFSTLSQWNQDVRLRNAMAPRSEEDSIRLLALAEQLGLRRVDMVLFSGDDEGRDKDKLDIMALVEFKKTMWQSGIDRDKLLKILPHIDTCPYAIVCGGLPPSDIKRNKNDAQAGGDVWFETAAKPIFADTTTNYYVCARLFSNPHTA